MKCCKLSGLRKNTSWLYGLVFIVLLSGFLSWSSVGFERNSSGIRGESVSSIFFRVSNDFVFDQDFGVAFTTKENYPRVEIEASAEEKEGNIVFSGRLRSGENNIEGKKIICYKILEDENKELGTTITHENGFFEFRERREDLMNGMLRFKVVFPGDDYLEKAESDPLFFNNLDRPFFALLSLIIIVPIYAGLFYLLARGIKITEFLLPIILIAGFATLTFGFLGLFLTPLVFGAILGVYIIKKETKLTKLRDQTRMGGLGGVIISAMFTTNTIFSLLVLSEPIEVIHTYSQNSFLYYNFLFSTIVSAIWFIAMMGLTVALIGSLKNFFAK